MPLPKPRKDEDKEDFLKRCMGNDTMNEEYPDNEQRYAVCNTQWRNRNKENDMIKKAFIGEITKSNDDDFTMTVVGSQESIDRDNEIVKVGGINLKHYKTNPVLLWAHNYTQPPIGKATRVWKSDGKLMFKLEFAKPEEYGFAHTIYNLYKGGYLNAFSIGFGAEPEDVEYPEPKKGRRSPYRIFNKIELRELSAVPVPANPQALVQSKGITKALADKAIDELELQELCDYCKECECEQEDTKETTGPIIKKPLAEQDWTYLLHHMHPPKRAEDMEELHHCPLFEKKGMAGEEYAQIHVKDKKVIWHALDVEGDALKGVSKVVYCHLDNAYKIRKKKIDDRRWAIISGMVDLDDTTWSEQDKEIAALEIKNAELELELCEKQVDEEIENDLYQELFDVFQGDSSEQEADVDQTEKLVEETLNTLKEK